MRNKLNFHNSYSTLPADSSIENSPRQVSNACFSYVNPIKPSNPKLIHRSQELIDELHLQDFATNSELFLNTLSGRNVLEGCHPYAMCYGGHQFGNWAGQLGDGRAINLFEIEQNGKPMAFQLKGAGPTPYSRRGDGFAVLRSSIREYLCSEAMHHLGIPTTRALSLVLTGDQVVRDKLYDGNPELEQGAIVCRVAPSFIRFGHFELFAIRQEYDLLKTITNYTLNTFFPELTGDFEEKVIQLLQKVSERTLDMVLHWQRVGFTHGVMNTDNMSILGLTIDYGPYGFLDDFDLNYTPNTTDAEQRRYRYGNQPSIALWNIYKLANALFPLVNEAKPLENILEQFKTNYEAKYVEMMCKKIGLRTQQEGDEQLITTLIRLLQQEETDYTIFFRQLGLFREIKNGIEILNQALYQPASNSLKRSWLSWFSEYENRLLAETQSTEERTKRMNAINPKYILRNYIVQEAIDKAERGDFEMVNELYNLLKKPYSEQERMAKYYTKRPEWARNKFGCSKLSCSS